MTQRSAVTTFSMFLVLVGVVGGFFAGGLIGASLDRNCRCDNPGLQGFIIGAPIGAIAGGVLGFLVASR